MGLLGIAVAGALLLTWRVQPLLATGLPASYLAFHLVPAIGYVLICAAGVARARGTSDPGRERQWRLLLVGAASSSAVAFVTGLVASVAYGPLEGFIAGLMVGATVPVALTLTLVISRAARARRASSARTPAAV